MRRGLSVNDFPRSVRKVLERAKAEVSPESIVLYGSRARGDERAISDFDFAFFGVTDDFVWTRFYNYVQHEAPTLFGIDLVRFERVSRELQSRIEGEGVAIDEPAET